MCGAKWLYISEGRVYNIPQPQNFIFKPINELANREVLEVSLYYETRARKPFRLIIINFDRVQLDENGGYSLTSEMARARTRNFCNYAFTTAEGLSQREDPLPIPDAPVLPNQNEIEILRVYIKEKHPQLYGNFSIVLNTEFEKQKMIHQEYINLIKKASILQKNPMKSRK